MIEAVELLKVHRSAVERLYPNHPELSKIDVLIAYGQGLVDAQAIQDVGDYLHKSNTSSVLAREDDTDKNEFARNLATKINEAVGSHLGDEIEVNSLLAGNLSRPNPRTPDDWVTFIRGLKGGEKNAVTHAIAGAAYGKPGIEGIKTLGDLRKMSPTEISNIAGVGERGILLLSMAFKVREESTQT